MTKLLKIMKGSGLCIKNPARDASVRKKIAYEIKRAFYRVEAVKIQAYCSVTTTRQKRFRHSFADRPKQFANYNASRLAFQKDAIRSPCWP